MKLVEISRILGCARKNLKEKTAFYVSYALFKILVKGKDRLPEVGDATLIKDDDNNHTLVIKLLPKWQDLLNNKNIDEILINELKSHVERFED